MDGVSCGVGVLGARADGWAWVGGLVVVSGGADAGGVYGGAGSTLAVVLGSEGAGEDGWEVWVDELVVGEEC